MTVTELLTSRPMPFFNCTYQIEPYFYLHLSFIIIKGHTKTKSIIICAFVMTVNEPIQALCTYQIQAYFCLPLRSSQVKGHTKILFYNTCMYISLQQWPSIQAIWQVPTEQKLKPSIFLSLDQQLAVWTFNIKIISVACL
jgi:hypothetical protein